jgi:Fe-S cluster assembly protein SufD
VDVGRAASYQGYQQVEAGHRMREELHVALTGEGAEARLAGVAHLLGRDHGDIALRIEHRASNTTSSSTYRGIAGERGHFVFKGQIHIPEGVRAIDAALTNKNLLLSNDAEIDTRPELTINADDVRCSHGATIGQLDADALFLLRARGIDATLARGLIMRAFAVAALHALPEDDVRALFTERLRDALGAPA